MELEENQSQLIRKKSTGSIIEPQSPNSIKNINDIFQDMLFNEENQQKIIEEKNKNIFTKHNKRNYKKEQLKRILNSSSSNQRFPSIKHDSSLQRSDRPRNLFQTQNSMDEQSFRTSFKKREESFSVENTIRDSSSSFSERSDSKSNQNQNILPAQSGQQDNQEPKKIGCNCKKSKCLNLYCKCFQKRLLCNQNCNCYDCGNHKPNTDTHNKAIISALSRNTQGFGFEYTGQQKAEQKFSFGLQLQQIKKGCKCRKTQCLKKYCQCFGSGQHCGIFCRCQQCQNTTYHEKK